MASIANRLQPEPPWGLWLVLGGMAIAPLSTKTAGAAWILFCLVGAWAALRRPRIDIAPGEDSAARTWLIACLIGLAFETLATAIWGDPWDELHAPIRLMLAAAATLGLVRRFRFGENFRDILAHALSLGCIAAAGLAAWKGDDRDSYPTNVIPWAVAVGFMVCLLLPRTLDATRPLRMRFAWMVASLVGMVAVVLSQTRGAYGVVLWAVLFYGVAILRRRSVTRHGVGLGIALALVLVAAGVLLPHVIQTSAQRIEQAAHEFELAAEAHKPGDGANSSVGARIYLWQMAVRGFESSPLIGIGGEERKRRIKALGEKTQSPMILSLGHVHNQYLHAAMDHGLLGLAAVLAWIGGLALTVRRLGRQAAEARWQLAGVLFMHMSASLTNVNFAHTYYGIMLSMTISLVLLNARREPVAPTAA